MSNLLKSLGKITATLSVLCYDIAAIPASWYLAYWLRFNLESLPPRLFMPEALLSLLILMVVQTACYVHFKVYRGLWRFSSINDVTRILKAILTAITIVFPILYLTAWLGHVPRSILPLYGILLMALLCGGRLIYRNSADMKNKAQQHDETSRVLIIGAGQAGEGLIRDLRRTSNYLPVGLVDDNQNKKGLDVHGVRVLGTTNELTHLVKAHQVDLVIIAIPSARSFDMRRVVGLCEASNIPFRTLPSIQALATGRVEVNALRDVNIEDLLGRDQVELNWDKIADNIQGKRILVTGAGGSIGSELCRQVMAQNPSQLLILDNSEFNLYKIEMELNEQFPSIPLMVSLTNIVDRVAIDRVFHEFRPEIVFHAAAYKHVPMLESQVRVAVQNNIIGTQQVVEASVAVDVAKFILISTDKAVNPSNIMGATKRVAEIYCQNLNARVTTQFVTVRFGNVLGSVGSVVPLFQEQLKKGGPLTVTHPEMKRYFMTIPEACQLILQAMANGRGGEIFVLDMGEPIKISYLAEQVIRLAGKEPGKDVEIQYVGLRPGEKLYEELFHDAERLEQTEHTKLFKAQFRKIAWDELSQVLLQLNEACARYQNTHLLQLLKNLVPEFTNPGAVARAQTIIETIH